jgi:hypothetical protein
LAFFQTSRHFRMWSGWSPRVSQMFSKQKSSSLPSLRTTPPLVEITSFRWASVQGRTSEIFNDSFQHRQREPFRAFADGLLVDRSMIPMSAGSSVQFFFNETKLRNQVSRFWLWDSHCENPVVGVEKRLPYLPQDQRSRTDPYLDIPPRWAVG